ncbi:hypothetical protein C8R43DRAFT_867293, partial [Mycena crocata]
MWLKSYLNFGPDRSLWTKFADSLFAIKVPKDESSDITVRENTFLQSWSTRTGFQTKILSDLRDLKTAEKDFDVRMECLAASREIIRDMPIWYHKHADPRIRRLNHAATSVCLRDNHKMKTVRDAERLADILNLVEHIPTDECECDACNETEENMQCLTPHSCSVKAQELLDTLPPKWDPRAEMPEDYELPPDIDDEWTTFDRRITTFGSIKDVFRVFTEGEICNTPPDMRLLCEPDLEPLYVATDGSCLNNGEDNAEAGAGIFFSEDNPNNMVIRVSDNIEQSNQTGEVVAVTQVALYAPIRREL